MVFHLKRRKITNMRILLIFVVLLSSGTSAVAHHATEIDYDENSILAIEGEIVSIDWINPHVIIVIESKHSSGSLVTWYVQAGTPNTLLRRGLNRNSLRARATILTIGAPGATTSPGKPVVISGFQITNLPCNQTCSLFGKGIVLPDGRSISIDAN